MQREIHGEILDAVFTPLEQNQDIYPHLKISQMWDILMEVQLYPKK